jgi:hypothetical protein
MFDSTTCSYTSPCQVMHTLPVRLTQSGLAHARDQPPGMHLNPTLLWGVTADWGMRLPFSSISQAFLASHLWCYLVRSCQVLPPHKHQ